MDDISKGATQNLLETLKSLRERELPFELVSYLRQDSQGSVTTVEDLLEFVHQNEEGRQLLQMAFARWDQADPSEKLRDTRAWTEERRNIVYGLLGFPDHLRSECDSLFKISARNGTEAAILAKNWTPWYDSREVRSDFYWNGYESVLRKKGWDSESLEKINLSASQVARRLANPTAEEAYQAKGLVVGYVQSGKTAHFTAVAAKAIDAGYRLIVVLGGMHNLLRSQTQRRLDMELVGTHNIMWGRNPEILSQRRDIDYANSDDEAWVNGEFLTHTTNPLDMPNTPSIVRLSHYQKDFQALGAGINAIDFRPPNQSKPVYAAENLRQLDVRLVVVKKNKQKLQAFVEDLRAQRANLSEIPALVIDDEADQASINTVNQRALGPEQSNRTAINKLITELLGEMPRAQYLAYTATPFANVFVNADDAGDLFPKDFIFTLEAPPNYMGGKDFHDLEGIPDGEEPNFKNSNRKAYVRPIEATNQEDLELSTREAIDAFVLSGAIKLWRHDNCPSGVSFRHHTMLIHESVRTAEHEETAGRVRKIWKTQSHESYEGLQRLRELYENDFKPMSEVRSDGYAFPEDFDDLISYVSEARGKIAADGNPVRVVNGTKDADYDPLVFDREDFWRILVGGSKLSRGFTVEGLTVSYYRRPSHQEDTLLQMGRWFGYRTGYKDLIRLYIDRRRYVGAKSFDLYEAFEAIVIDEIKFRKELVGYDKVDENGTPIVEPRQVPPLVHSSADWLKPTARNKMYNAQLVKKGIGGVANHLSIAARVEDQPDVHRHNFELVLPWFRDRLFDLVELQGTSGKFSVEIAILPATDLVAVLDQFLWHDKARTAGAKIGYLKGLVEQGSFNEFVLVKKLESQPRTVVINGVSIPMTTHKRRANRGDFDLPFERFRHSLEAIAGRPVEPLGDIEAGLRRDCRGAVMVSFATEEGLPEDLSLLTSRDIAPIFTYATPHVRGELPVTAWQYVNPKRPDDVVVDRRSPQQ
jgi:hypothetical protein